MAVKAPVNNSRDLLCPWPIHGRQQPRSLQSTSDDGRRIDAEIQLIDSRLAGSLMDLANKVPFIRRAVHTPVKQGVVPSGRLTERTQQGTFRSSTNGRNSQKSYCTYRGTAKQITQQWLRQLALLACYRQFLRIGTLRYTDN